MSNINNKLILVLGIFIFIFGFSLASSTYAQNTGVLPFPYYNNSDLRNRGDYPTPVYYSTPTPTNYNNQGVIPGCEGRNTGYSTATGQSCVGSYVNNASTNTNNNNTSSSNTTSTNSDTTNTTVSKTTDTDNTITTSKNDNNSFSGLTANALEGSDSFLPTGLLQWIFLAVIVVAIIFLWRYVFAEEKYLSEPLKHA